MHVTVSGEHSYKGLQSKTVQALMLVQFRLRPVESAHQIEAEQTGFASNHNTVEQHL